MNSTYQSTGAKDSHRRRPGERREPMLIHTEISTGFRTAAAEFSIDAELAVTLALERVLTLDDASTAGVAIDVAQPYLNRRAAEAKVVRELTGPLSAYLQALTGRARFPRLESPVAVPVRLFPRVLSVDVGAALVPDILNEAVAWERAAVLSGRLMSEWALIHVAQLCRSADSPIADAGGTARQLA
jgi:hypothetical protein